MKNSSVTVCLQMKADKRIFAILDLRHGRRKWKFLSGLSLPDEKHVKQIAARIVFEETGIRVSSKQIDCQGSVNSRIPKRNDRGRMQTITFVNHFCVVDISSEQISSLRLPSGVEGKFFYPNQISDMGDAFLPSHESLMVQFRLITARGR